MAAVRDDRSRQIGSIMGGEGDEHMQKRTMPHYLSDHLCHILYEWPENRESIDETHGFDMLAMPQRLYEQNDEIEVARYTHDDRED